MIGFIWKEFIKIMLTSVTIILLGKINYLKISFDEGNMVTEIIEI